MRGMRWPVSLRLSEEWWAWRLSSSAQGLLRPVEMDVVSCVLSWLKISTFFSERVASLLLIFSKDDILLITYYYFIFLAFQGMIQFKQVTDSII